MGMFWSSPPKKEPDPDEIARQRAKYEEWLEEYRNLFNKWPSQDKQPTIWSDFDYGFAKKLGVKLD